jgi:hypothetical protein
LLKKNIIKHIESIVDEVDLEDIKGEIISRYGLHKAKGRKRLQRFRNKTKTLSTLVVFCKYKCNKISEAWIVILT